MKLFALLTPLLATAATAASAISSQEQADWQGCTNKLIDDYNNHSAGDPTSCRFWRCLHRNADKYHRGGGITVLSNIVTPLCIPIELLPDLHIAPEPSWQEVQDWRTCTRDLIAALDTPATGNQIACRMWACLHNNVSKYNRGGFVTRTSKLLTPICEFAGIIPDWK